jgi:hypothetical protein
VDQRDLPHAGVAEASEAQVELELPGAGPWAAGEAVAAVAAVRAAAPVGAAVGAVAAVGRPIGSIAILPALDARGVFALLGLHAPLVDVFV